MAEEVDIQTQPFYLKKAKLKGYKSIKDAEVDFCDGLNIIIGKNASGKSNLLELLFDTLNLNTDSRFPTNTEITLHGLKDLKISASYNSNNGLNLNLKTRGKDEQPKFTFFYDNQKIEDEVIYANARFIRHHLPNPENYPIISSPFYFNYYSDEKYADINLRTIESEFLSFLVHQFMNLHHPDYLAIAHFKKFNLESLKNEFTTKLGEKIIGLNQLFDGLTPIEGIRFNPYFNIHHEKENGIYVFSNLFIDYKVKSSWLPYSSLSEGIKRLFFIISELYFSSIAGFQNKLFNFKGEDTKRNIVFIEEPELGIHPHQLHQLMTFIKEQSEEKQIILSTHSPMVLDVLGKDDLHRIIIASNDDPKKGSQFRHLTEKEKAKLYMDGDYLSDYWKYSDLEK